MAERMTPFRENFMKKEERVIPEGRTEIAETEIAELRTRKRTSAERPIETLAEAAEILRETDQISTEMFDALISDAESPEEVRDVLRELNSFLELREAETAKPPEKARDSLGHEDPGINFYYLYLKERGQEIKTIYKPSAEEKEGPTESQGLRPGISRGSYYKREWLAYMVDRAFGLRIVPTTVLRREKNGIGSVQKWVKEAKTLLEDPTRKINEEDEVKMALLDDVTGQQDRHKGNYVVGEDGHGEAIDNALSFGPAIKALHREEAVEILPALTAFSGPLEQAKEIDPRIHARVIKKVEAFTKSTRRQEVLKKAFDFILGNDADEIWQAFLEKTFTIVGDKRLPVDYDQGEALTKIKYALGEEAVGAVAMAEAA